MEQLLVLGAVVLLWWLPVLRVTREMDLIPGLPRPLFWVVLPLIGLPLLGPIFYFAWLKPRFVRIGRANAERRARLERDRRARGAGTDGRPR
ncbi:MAG: hypothetical protein RLZZ432_712 [Chloroflexota bacterium]